MFDDLNTSGQALMDEIIGLVYFMRGAVTYEEMWNTTPVERQRIDKFIEGRFEIEKKNPHPVY